MIWDGENHVTKHPRTAVDLQVLLSVVAIHCWGLTISVSTPVGPLLSRSRAFSRYMELIPLPLVDVAQVSGVRFLDITLSRTFEVVGVCCKYNSLSHHKMISFMLTISKGNVFVTSCPLYNVCLVLHGIPVDSIKFPVLIQVWQYALFFVCFLYD